MTVTHAVIRLRLRLCLRPAFGLSTEAARSSTIARPSEDPDARDR